MTERHHFNEKKKRFEPAYTKCCFCQEAHSGHMDYNYFINLYKTTDRTNVIVYSSVKFNMVNIGVARCKSCAEIHERSYDKAVTIIILTAAAVILLSFLLWGSAGFFVLVIAAIAGQLSLPGLERKFVWKHGIHTRKDGAESDTTVQALLYSGWSFVRPRA